MPVQMTNNPKWLLLENLAIQNGLTNISNKLLGTNTQGHI